MLDKSIAGGSSAGIAKTCMAPLERVRIIRQASDRGRGGSLSLLRAIYDQEGVRGLWKGNLVNLSRVVPSYAIRFSVFGRLSDMGDRYELFRSPFVRGSISGLASALASYPLEVIRTRMSVHGSLFDAIRRGKLYAGSSLTFAETMPYAGLTLGTYSFLKDNFSASSQDRWSRMGFGLISGFVATLVCFPLDTLRRNKMVNSHVSISQLVSNLFQEGGALRLYRGASVALVKSPPTVAMTMLLNDYFLERKT